MDRLITTAEAARELGVVPSRVVHLIRAGRLHATKVGRDWVIERAALDAVRERPTGYPKGRPRTGIFQGVPIQLDPDRQPETREERDGPPDA